MRSVVTIRDLSDNEIDAYVATGEPLDKAGGYAIQGEAASMVASVRWVLHERCRASALRHETLAGVRWLSPEADSICPEQTASIAAH